MVVMIDLLRKLGLTKYEAVAYLSLVKLGSSSAFNLSKSSGVPFGRIYDSLNTLELKGLVEVVPSKPKKYVAVNPRQALYGLIDDGFNELTKLRGEVSERVKELSTISADELVLVNTGKSNFAKCLKQHLSYERELWATSDDFSLEKWYPSIKRSFKESNGLANRFILANASRADLARLKEVSDYGINIKHFPLPGVRLLVSDESLVTISLQHPGHEWVNIQVRDEFLGKAMTKLLRTAYGRAKKL